MNDNRNLIIGIAFGSSKDLTIQKNIQYFPTNVKSLDTFKKDPPFYTTYETEPETEIDLFKDIKNAIRMTILNEKFDKLFVSYLHTDNKDYIYSEPFRWDWIYLIEDKKNITYLKLIYQIHGRLPFFGKETIIRKF